MTLKYDIVIIGSGVAGLTAGIYAGRANKSVLIIENSVLGGTTATLDLIENYPGFDKISGLELINKMFGQVSALGVQFEFLSISKIDFDTRIIYTADNQEINYKALIIASGTSCKRLNINNPDEFLFKGLSYCAVCDGALYKNKKIAVVTDGISGSSSIDYLQNITNDIIIFDIKNLYKNNKFNVLNNAKILSINGDGKVKSISYQLGSGDIQNLNVDGVFVALGKETNLDLYRDNLILKNNYISTDENMQTNINGVFAIGDIRDKKLRQIITACSDGAIASTEAIKFINANF